MTVRGWMVLIGIAVGVMMATLVFSPEPESWSKDGDSDIPSVTFEMVAEGLKQPVAITHANDGSNRLFICEQRGRIQVLTDGKLQPEPFLDIRDKVRSGGERGLLCLEFHPDFPKKPLCYINYTAEVGGLHTFVSELTVNDGKADPGSERVLMRVKQPWGNHNGGQLHFGPDGYLYIAFGDGGAARDPKNSGQDLGSVLGSICRIDVNSTDGDLAYGISKDNPFVDRKGARPEIYAWGLRNTWRFCFDPNDGTLYTGDVGQTAFEEINVIIKGGNYGWRIMEGDIRTPKIDPVAKPKDLIGPIVQYPRSQGISVTGGYVYRGKSIPGMDGVYVYGDYSSGRVWGLRYDPDEEKLLDQRQICRTEFAISTFGVDEDGEIYVADHVRGRVHKMLMGK
jgi:glucose/arabinose dehydrogenase